MWSRSPVEGSTVNITPERTEGTISCTTTHDGRLGPSTPCRPRLSGRAPHNEAQQSTTRPRSSFSPATLVNVSFMPANEVPSASSPMPDDRTATRMSAPQAPVGLHDARGETLGDRDRMDEIAGLAGEPVELVL